MNLSEMPFWFQRFESGGGRFERRKCVWILLSLESTEMLRLKDCIVLIDFLNFERRKLVFWNNVTEDMFG